MNAKSAHFSARSGKPVEDKSVIFNPVLITLNSFKIFDAIVRRGFYLSYQKIHGIRQFQIRLSLGRSTGRWRP